jgi:hypothetical protein
MKSVKAITQDFMQSNLLCLLESVYEKRGANMKIGGISIILILGIMNFILLLFQISSGLRWVRVPMTFHRKIGITLFITAFIHGTLAILTQ